jgi:hypothetical protein
MRTPSCRKSRLATKAPLPSALPAALAQTITQLSQAYAQAQASARGGGGGDSGLALATVPSSSSAAHLNSPAAAVVPPPLPDLAIDAAVFDLPTRTPLPPLPTSAPTPLDDEALVVQYGVSDSFVPLYTAASDVARLGTEVLDPDTGLRVLQQSEPELQQLLYTLERQEQLRIQLSQRHEQLNAEQRTLETATTQLQTLATQLEQHAQQHDAELQRAKDELRALVAEVTRAHETLSTGGGVQDALGTLRSQQQQLSAEHAAQQQRMEQIVPEGQRLIAQLQQLTAPAVMMSAAAHPTMPLPMMGGVNPAVAPASPNSAAAGDSDDDSDEDEDSGVVARSSSKNKNKKGEVNTKKKKAGGLFSKRK